MGLTITLHCLHVQLQLQFFYPTGSHDKVQQFYTYEWDSYIADIGGYLVFLLIVYAWNQFPCPRACVSEWAWSASTTWVYPQPAPLLRRSSQIEENCLNCNPYLCSRPLISVHSTTGQFDSIWFTHWRLPDAFARQVNLSIVLRSGSWAFLHSTWPAIPITRWRTSKKSRQRFKSVLNIILKPHNEVDRPGSL